MGPPDLGLETVTVRALKELEKVKIEARNREFINRG
jgi:hypothetical protein